MSKRKKRVPVFIGLLFISILIFTFSKNGWMNNISGVLQSIILPVQRETFIFFHKNDKSELANLKNQIIDLQTKLVKTSELEKDNQALRDQFAVTNPPPKTLLPAFIVGMPNFLPGISIVDEITIDKGTSDLVKTNDYVVYKDNLIGKIVKTTPHMSIVYLLNHKGISLTAESLNSSAIGICNGTDEDKILLENVSLSDTLKTGDTIITKDSPSLVIGKLISINKKVSSLFQSAEIKSLVDVKKLQTVFVMIDG